LADIDYTHTVEIILK